MTNFEEKIIKEFDENIFHMQVSTHVNPRHLGEFEVKEYLLKALAQQREEIVKEIMDETIKEMQKLNAESWDWDRGDSEIPKIKKRILDSLTSPVPEEKVGHIIAEPYPHIHLTFEERNNCAYCIQQSEGKDGE